MTKSNPGRFFEDFRKGETIAHATPRTLTEAMAAGGDEAKRAFDAMMKMKKIDVAAIDAARRGA